MPQTRCPSARFIWYHQANGFTITFKRKSIPHFYQDVRHSGIIFSTQPSSTLSSLLFIYPAHSSLYTSIALVSMVFYTLWLESPDRKRLGGKQKSSFTLDSMDSGNQCDASQAPIQSHKSSASLTEAMIFSCNRLCFFVLFLTTLLLFPNKSVQTSSNPSTFSISTFDQPSFRSSIKLTQHPSTKHRSFR